MNISAEWIWLEDGCPATSYNQMVAFRRDFRLESLPANARLAISADTRYRLKVNGQWLNDGPARAYPNHYSYDELCLDGILRVGINRIEAEVRYFGCPTFHQLPLRGGFLAQLEMDYPDGCQIIKTDAQWQAHRIHNLLTDAPKLSIQQGPYEIFDASNGSGENWQPASPVSNPPWSGLTARETPLMTRKEAQIRRVCAIHRVMPESASIGLSARQWLDPDPGRLETFQTFPIIFAFEFTSPRAQTVKLKLFNLTCSVNGTPSSSDGQVQLRAGANFFAGGLAVDSGHWADASVLFPFDSGISNSDLGEVYGAKWDDLVVVEHDFEENPELYRSNWLQYQQRLAETLKINDMAAFKAHFRKAELLHAPVLCQLAPHLDFEFRTAEPAETGDVLHPQYLVYPDDRCTVINPVPDRDVEICCDLGEQNVGYWNFTLFAPRGTVVDVAAVEYITSSGKIQHTLPVYRNSMRYICRSGFNRFTSYQRRSGRYIFITLRNVKAPVRFQSFRLVESTYPVIPDGEFFCSEVRLDQVYSIAQRTLKMCMEDTFTDCPLYEQTLWIGDARSEALFAMSSFGAYDLVRHCIRLGAESLERLPLVGSQVPSGWTRLIPIWSFMWSMGVEDYYLETGDLAFTREIWPAVKQNLRNAAAMTDDRTDLFRRCAWNLFDWSRTDCRPDLMLQNSFFMIGALKSAGRLAAMLDDSDFETFCGTLAARLTAALDRVWDTRRLAYPDSLDDQGRPSKDIAVHTSMLAVLYDAAGGDQAAAVRTNTVSPRHELIPISSPFAAFYYYQALEKLGQQEAVIETIRRDYFKMLDIGSTSVWESFPSDPASGEFPTRSHCHAWSSAPLYFLPRMVLGLIPDGVGGKHFLVSPCPAGLQWARGARPTIHGRIAVEWRKTGEHAIEIAVAPPPGVTVEFRSNELLAEFEVDFRVVS